MTYQPQRSTAPAGPEMVVVRAEDWERLRAFAEDEEDVRETRRKLAAALDAPVWALEDEDGSAGK